MKIKEFVDSNKGSVNTSILGKLFIMDSEIHIDMMGIKGCPNCKDQSNQTQLETGPWTSAYACYNCNSIFFIMWTDRMGGSHKDHVLIYKEKSSLLDKKLDNNAPEPIVSKESEEKHHEVEIEDEGGGSFCCGKRMVLSPSEITYECLECGGWEYSSS